MTDHPPLTDDDLSLALDGEADAELLARIAADPDAEARLERMRAAAELVGSTPVPPLSDGAVDELIANAVDAPVAPTVAAGTRRRAQRGATPWLVAAAVIVLMAVGLSLVWAGRSTDDDQASATLASQSADSAESSGGGGSNADSSFSKDGSTAADEGLDSLAGGHGAPTTVAPESSSGRAAALPLLYLGPYDPADALRDATASSFADAWKASGSQIAYQGSASDTSTGTQAQDPPSPDAVDRCGDQLQVTLSTKAAPVQTGYATVDAKQVLVYEFAAASARDGKETTLVAAVGTDACDEVVIFER